MLPHRSHNYTNSPNSYQFDMRVNVDFATGHVQLGLPQQIPFTQKSSNQLVHPVPFAAQPARCSSPQLPTGRHKPLPQLPDRHSLSGLSNSHSTVKAGIGQGGMMEHSMPVFHRVEPQPQQHSTVGHTQQQQPPDSRKTPSLTSTYNCEQSMQAVECVICEKLIQRDNFKQHLEEHRKRRLHKKNETFSDMSIRNQNSEAEARQLIKNATFNREYFRSRGEVMSQNSLLSHPSKIISHPSQFVQQPSQSEFYLSSSSFQEPIIPKEELVMGGQDISVGRSDPLLIDQSAGSQSAFSKNQGIATRESPKKLTYQKIESIFIRKPNAAFFEDCGQSLIEPLHQMSRQSSVGDIQRQLKESKISSQSQISLRAEPGSSHNSAGLPLWKVKSRQNLSEKLSHIKMPVNFLAHEDFMSCGGSLRGSDSKNSK